MWNRFLVALALLPLGACSASNEAPASPGGGGAGGGTAGTAGASTAGSTGFGGGGGNDAGGGGGGGSVAGSGGSTVAGGGGSGGTTTGSGPCGASGLFVCDDFESLSEADEPAGPNWIPQPEWQSERIVVDSSKAHSGSNSIRLVSTNYGTQLVAAMGFPPPNNTFYARAWMQLGKSTEEIANHVAFIEGAETETDAGEELRLGASHGIVDVNLIPGNKGSGGGEKTQFSNGDVDIPSSGAPGVVLEADTWYCLEALFDGQNHEFRLWIDGEEITALHVTDWQQMRTNWSPDYQFGKIGGQNFSGDAGTIWFDDVAFGSGPIGCGG